MNVHLLMVLRSQRLLFAWGVLKGSLGVGQCVDTKSCVSGSLKDNWCHACFMLPSLSFKVFLANSKVCACNVVLIIVPSKSVASYSCLEATLQDYSYEMELQNPLLTIFPFPNTKGSQAPIYNFVFSENYIPRSQTLPADTQF